LPKKAAMADLSLASSWEAGTLVCTVKSRVLPLVRVISRLETSSTRLARKASKCVSSISVMTVSTVGVVVPGHPEKPVEPVIDDTETVVAVLELGHLQL